MHNISSARTALGTAVNPNIKPLYVNPRQYHRIQIRRQQRMNLHKRIRFIPKKEQKFQYLSRHKHACRRRRGPSGRFLTKAELQKMEEDEKAKEEKTVEKQTEAGQLKACLEENKKQCLPPHFTQPNETKEIEVSEPNLPDPEQLTQSQNFPLFSTQLEHDDSSNLDQN